jgi:hypothetical protein
MFFLLSLIRKGRCFLDQPWMKKLFVLLRMQENQQRVTILYSHPLPYFLSNKISRSGNKVLA